MWTAYISQYDAWDKLNQSRDVTYWLLDAPPV